MALAQPTNLVVQSLEPVATLEQSVQRVNPAATVATLEQWTGGARPARTVATLEQSVTRVQPARTVATLRQRTGYVLTPARTVAVLEQSVVFSRVQPARTVATLAQSVTRIQPARTVARLRQVVLADAQAVASRTRVTLDGEDVTARTVRDIRIRGSEGDARTASLRLSRFPVGPVAVMAYQGLAVTIGHIISGQLVMLFTGTVERPVWDHQRRQLVLECSDLRHERVGGEDRAQLQAMTGGLMSPIAQRADSTGADWVSELMKTVPGSLDYTGAGVLRYSPWAVGTPRYTLENCDIHHQGVSFEFATRAEVTNRISSTLEYRRIRRNTLSYDVGLNVEESGYCKLAGCLPAAGITLPSRQALLAAAEGVANWHLVAFSYRDLPADGWYRYDALTKKAWSATAAIRAARAMGADATLERYISQPQREVYELTIEAPESIDQFGAVDASGPRVSVETRIDGSIFEERGCTITADPDDRRADVNLAIQSLQRQAERRILDSHRRNHAEFRSRRDILPVEIGDPISVSSASVQALGTVTEFQHVVTPQGADYTSIKLAVSLVSSNVSVTEDWSLPAPPAQYRLNADSQALPATPDCPAPVGQAAVTGPSRIEPDGTVVIVAPSVDRSQVDEIIGTRRRTYPVQIPRDTLTVEVT